MPLKSSVLAVLLGVTLLGSPALAGTAFQTEAIAAKVVSPNVQGKLVWARADEGGVDPRKWSFLFFDPYADENGRHVVVRNGAVSQIQQGFVELDHARLLSYKPAEVMPAAKLKVDSDAALHDVVTAANLGNIRLSSVDYSLQMDEDNDVPVWTLKLYMMQGQSETSFCTARVSAFTGQIFSLKVDHDKLPQH